MYSKTCHHDHSVTAPEVLALLDKDYNNHNGPNHRQTTLTCCRAHVCMPYCPFGVYTQKLVFLHINLPKATTLVATILFTL